MRILLVLLGLTLVTSTIAQEGGKSTYDFLSIPVSARAMGLGGMHNHVYDGDAGLAIHNPAMLQPSMHKYMSLSYSPYFAGTHYANFNYAHDFNLATFQFGTVFMNYGQMTEYDEFGVDQGLFNVTDVALYAGAGHEFKDKFAFGANAKLVYSQVETYSSLGMGVDLAAMYKDTAGLFVATLLVKNLGFQLKSYTKNNQELLPVDVQIGFSKRFKHLPFRLNVTAHNFYQWDIRYDDPNALNGSNTNIFDEEEDEPKKAGVFFDNLMRHLVLGGELELGKALRVGFGYNHQRRAELGLESRRGLSGFSFGVGLHIKRFDIQYGMGKYALAGAANQLTLNINLGEQIKVKKSSKNKD